MKFTLTLLAIVVVMCFSLSKGLPQLAADDKEFPVIDPLEEQESFFETHFQAKREVQASDINNEVAGGIGIKRDVHNKNTNEKCCANKSPNQNCCGSNSGSTGSGNADGVNAGNWRAGGTSNCVCNSYPRNNMNNNNNNMGAAVYNNMYYICNCGTNPNPGNVMSCCVPNTNNRKCNCCSDCQCGCNNGTNVCMCVGSSYCRSSQSNKGGNVCYTFDKTCCSTENTKNLPLNTGFTNHHGPIFVYNNYYYYCTCAPNNNVRDPSTCSTTCTCGCQPNVVQSSNHPKTFESVTHVETQPTQTTTIAYTYKGKIFSSFDELRNYLEREDHFTTHQPAFTHSHATRPGVRFNLFDNNNLGARYGDLHPYPHYSHPHPHHHSHPQLHRHPHHYHSAKSNPYMYTFAFGRGHTDAPIYPQETEIPTTTPATTTHNYRRHHNRDRFGGSGMSGIDLSELFRRL